MSRSDSSRPMDLTSEKAACAFAIVQKLKAAGFEALFAGGCIRDHLLGIAPTDYDVATSATPDTVEKIFEKTIPVGKQFGVILVILKGIQFEVATFRTEGGYQDGRRPGFVNFSNAEEDARRRDFTVNGLFYDPLAHRVLDFVNGQADLERKQICCIGNPAERFEEDKLRLLRAVRFAVKLNFSIDPVTESEIKKRADQILDVSLERVRDEIAKIITSPNARVGLELLAKFGLWKAVWPALDHDEILFSRFTGPCPDIALANAMMFWRSDRDKVLEMMRRLRFSNSIIDQTLHILKLVDKLATFFTLRPGEQKIVAADARFFDAKLVYSKEPAGAKSIDKINEITKPWKDQELEKPFLTGEDLKSIGIQEGPWVGKILTEAYLLQLEESIQTREQALAWAEKQAKN